MGLAKKAIKIEKSYVRSTPYGPRNTFNGSNGQPWCAYFQHYCLKKASKKLGKWFEGCPNFAFVPSIYEWAKKNGRVRYHGEPGDLVLFDWNANKSPDHIGMLIKKQGGVYVTVEGNTSNVSQGNGGCVQTRYREPKWVMCFVRPPYKAKKKKKVAKGYYPNALPKTTLREGVSGSDVRKWQKFLNWAGYDLKVDGDFNAMTRRATMHFQKDAGIKKDGIVGPATLRAAKDHKKE